MRLLIDAQLPPGLCVWFRQQGQEAQHVSEVLGGQTPDADVVVHAERNGLVLVSKDEDFVLRFPGRGFTLIWLRCGNISNRALREWLGERWPAILDRLEAGERLIEVR